MTAARAAGWQSLFGGILLSLIALAWREFVLLSKFAGILETIIFWAIVIYAVTHFLYAAWGLWLGYNAGAWKRYCEREERETVEMVERMKR